MIIKLLKSLPATLPLVHLVAVALWPSWFCQIAGYRGSRTRLTGLLLDGSPVTRILSRRCPLPIRSS